MLESFFLHIFAHLNQISLVQFSPGSAEADIGWGRKMAGHLIGSCDRNISTKNYKIGKPAFEWQSIMFGMFFLRTQCIKVLHSS